MTLIIQPVVKALTRRHLTLGGEREPVMCSVFIAAVLVVLTLNLQMYAFLPAIAMVLGAALLVFRAMATKDPHMVQVAFRRRKYKARYTSRPIPALVRLS